jgi:hypothetical protein
VVVDDGLVRQPEALLRVSLGVLVPLDNMLEPRAVLRLARKEDLAKRLKVPLIPKLWLGRRLGKKEA